MPLVFGVTKDCKFSEFRHVKVQKKFLNWWTNHLMIIHIMSCVSHIWVKGSCQLSINQNQAAKETLLNEDQVTWMCEENFLEGS